MYFYQIFRLWSAYEGLELVMVWGVSGNSCYYGKAFKFLALNFVGVRKPKAMNGFSPNFQHMFNPRVSKAEYVLGSIWQQLFSMAILLIILTL